MLHELVDHFDTLIFGLVSVVDEHSVALAVIESFSVGAHNIVIGWFDS